jgi:hypothetical protein
MPLSKNKGYDGSVWRNVKVDSNGRLLVDVNSQTEKDRHSHVYDGTNWLELRRADIIKSILKTTIALNASVTLWTPVSGKTINLMGISISRTGKLYDSLSTSWLIYDGTTLFGNLSLQHNSVSLNFPNNGIKFSAVDNALTIKNVSTESEIISSTAWGYET